MKQHIMPEPSGLMTNSHITAVDPLSYISEEEEEKIEKPQMAKENLFRPKTVILSKKIGPSGDLNGWQGIV